MSAGVQSVQGGQIAYFDKNKQSHTRYVVFPQKRLSIGSGPLGAACKAAIGKCLKQSAMAWTARGANAITALRCALLSNHDQDYWEKRAP